VTNLNLNLSQTNEVNPYLNNKGKGCVEFNVTLKEIGVEPRNYISMIYFEAKVVEASTGRI
jgi:hypothetical protein